MRISSPFVRRFARTTIAGLLLILLLSACDAGGSTTLTQGGANSTPTSTIGKITEFGLPRSAGADPQGITGPDGNLWFTEYSGNKIGRITPTGTVTEFAIPTPVSYPEGITAGPDHNLWLTETTGNNIGRITLHRVPCAFYRGPGRCHSSPGPDRRSPGLAGVKLSSDQLWHYYFDGSTSPAVVAARHYASMSLGLRFYFLVAGIIWPDSRCRKA